MDEFTQVATADRAQPAVVLTNDTPSKRLLRTANTEGVGEDDEEERGLNGLVKKLVAKKDTPLLQHIPEDYVTKLLGDKQLRRSAFHDWNKADIDGNGLSSVLKSNDDSTKLIRKYVKFIS
ncbi:hypothetical protein PF010_g25738 [Phytophthora fragariae]|uniref:RxLR effector protein n=1 Tax=Phytophthora fragariae TaxID=53985 RepID=A0A6A3HWA5_9STRA|nr:hypothetical protein PF011_g25128 [Phytophthora fragariae]KAE9071777.1 hypothetical protein PF010_g25738 [Phytophthora fragariae]KAE9179391.1 hypothetical protein PF004_g25177 [Phytophthora fragariae]KAE9289784.1 hypothetical protein PF008_g25808 [Phytophthora fragariae]